MASTNMPEMQPGTFSTRVGGIMASADQFFIVIHGVGGHAAVPHSATDPVLIAAHVTIALQSTVSRNLNPMRSGVLSVTMVHGGEVINAIPATVTLSGTVRTLDENVRDLIEARLKQVATSVAEGLGGTAGVDYKRHYPVLVNAAAQVDFAARAALEVAGSERVQADTSATLLAEGFAYMLQARPGAFIFLGNGRPDARLHSDSYDFNDDVIPLGVSYGVRLIEGASAR